MAKDSFRLSSACLSVPLLIMLLSWLPSSSIANGQVPLSRQTTVGQEIRRKQLKAEIGRIHDLMNASAEVPPPIAANALLLLRESGALQSDQSRRELAIWVLDLARSMPLTPPSKNLSPPTQDILHPPQRVAKTQIDKFDITLRAVRLLAGVDQEQALAALGALATVQIPSVSCRASVIYDYDSLYETVGLVADHLTVRSKTPRIEFIDVVTPFLMNLQSAAQVLPALKLLATVDPASEDFERFQSLL